MPSASHVNSSSGKRGDGEKCRFSHQQPACRFFSTPGGCLLGEKCRFSHEQGDRHQQGEGLQPLPLLSAGKAGKGDKSSVKVPAVTGERGKSGKMSDKKSRKTNVAHAHLAPVSARLPGGGGSQVASVASCPPQLTGSQSDQKKKKKRKKKRSKKQEEMPDGDSHSMSLEQQVLRQPPLMLTILKHLNPYNIDDMKSIISLKQLGLLSAEDLRYYFKSRFHVPMISDFAEEFDFSPRVMGGLGLDVQADEYYLHEEMNDNDVKDILRDVVLKDEPKSSRKWLKGKSRQVVWRKYGFLSYVPKTVYVTIRKAQIVRKRYISSKPLHGVRLSPCYLHDAVGAGITNREIDLLVNRWLADVNIKAGNCVPNLHWAARRGHTETLKYLIARHHLDPFETSLDPLNYGSTLAHFAANSGRIDTLRYVCETLGVNPNITNRPGFTSMHYAATSGSIECVEYLARRGLDPDARALTGTTPVMLAARGGNLELLRLFADKYGANMHLSPYKDPPIPVPRGDGLLHFAALSAMTHTFKALVETYEVDGSSKDELGCSAIHRAVMARSKEGVRILIEDYGFDPKVRDARGATLAHYAAEKNAVELMRMLFDVYKLDPMAVTENGRTCWHWADKSGAIEAEEILLDEYGLEYDYDYFGTSDEEFL